MVKNKREVKTIPLILAGLIWFLAVSFTTAQTEYQNVIADKLADPQGTSTQLESILNVLIVVATFIPTGFILAYLYIKKNFKDYRIFKASLLSMGIALALYVPFSWYNFVVNFGN